MLIVLLHNYVNKNCNYDGNSHDDCEDNRNGSKAQCSLCNRIIENKKLYFFHHDRNDDNIPTFNKTQSQSEPILVKRNGNMVEIQATELIVY